MHPMRHQTSTPLSSFARPWLLALALALSPLPHLALAPVPAAHAQSRIGDIKGDPGAAIRSDDVPAGESGWTYRLGTGADTDGLRPATYSNKLRIDADFSAGFGYSCGQFDPFANVESMVNSAIDKFRSLPQRFVMAVQAAVSALPAYLLNKINPSLYNVITKQLDEAFRLFEINFKDCQQMEREIALGQNPYHNLVQAGMGDRMRVEMGFGSGTIDDRMETVRTSSASNGVVLAGGKRYGGDGQPPIEMARNVLTAGINLLADRGVNDTSAFAASLRAKHPITQAFTSPEQLVTFVTDIYGNQAFKLTKSGPTQSKPGYGYQKKYIELRDEAIERLQRHVRQETERTEFERESEMRIPPATVEAMRKLSPYDLSITVDDQARAFAIEQLQLRFAYALQALETGLREPNLAQSEAYEVLTREAAKLRMAIQDDMAHLNNARLLH